MDWGTLATIASAIGTGFAAYFTAKTAYETKKMAEHDIRPFLIITPDIPRLDFTHKPSISICNYGKGPAILHEIKCYGLEIHIDRTLHKPTEIQQASTPTTITCSGDIIGSLSEVIYQPDTRDFTAYFGEHDGVRFEVEYEDLIGNVYVSFCEWKNGRWVRRNTKK
jgi:hypothetical protein